jgi:hypothetical protein
MAKNMKDKEDESAWSISIGFYPGVLIGMRTYEQENLKTHVIYLPFVDLAIEIWS